MTGLFLKCLDNDMRSCNGGNQQWQLNKWYSVKGKISICENGLHLTLKPQTWNGQRVFIAETPKIYDFEDNKAVCRKARLLKELPPQILKEYVDKEALIWKKYEDKRALIWKEYEGKEALIWKEYEDKEALIWKEYEDKRAPIWEEYKESCQEFLKYILGEA